MSKNQPTSTAPAEKKSPAKSDAVLNKYSRHITQPKSQGASQAIKMSLHATGMTLKPSMQKPRDRHLQRL